MKFDVPRFWSVLLTYEALRYATVKSLVTLIVTSLLAQVLL